ncbi:MAG: hypothetical protein RL722_544 [Pseudomonadota bacterium]|jgi:D-amino-acid dehydrogenase
MAPAIPDVLVIGAGMVGVCCALQLRRAGLSVSLLDRRGPGEETSHGNAGVLTPSSLLPLNHPGLWRALPALLRGRSTGLRLRARHLPQVGGWALRFLAQARPARTATTVAALHALITLSRPLHEAWRDQAGVQALWQDQGWLLLQRSLAGWEAQAPVRALYRQHGLACEELDAQGLQALEPALAPRFPRALWVQGAAAVSDPGALVRAYAGLAARAGVTVLRDEVRHLRPGLRPDPRQDLRPDPSGSGSGWQVEGASGVRHLARQVVVAAGPWSAQVLAPLGLQVPLGHERGYHQHYTQGATLRRPIHDAAAGYVLAPMAQGLRLCTGVELAPLEAPDDLHQLQQVEAAARQALDLGRPSSAPPWRGARPSLPDSRPAIGPAPGLNGLWLALGHQHIGFSTGPGTAALLTALMTGQAAPIDPAPFDPSRWIRLRH